MLNVRAFFQIMRNRAPKIAPANAMLPRHLSCVGAVVTLAIHRCRLSCIAATVRLAGQGVPVGRIASMRHGLRRRRADERAHGPDSGDVAKDHLLLPEYRRLISVVDDDAETRIMRGRAPRHINDLAQFRIGRLRGRRDGIDVFIVKQPIKVIFSAALSQ